MDDASSLERDAVGAFGAVRRPLAEEIAPCPCEECDELRASFAAYSSDAIPQTILDRHRWDLPLFSDDGKQYYLLAWLVQSILDPVSDYTAALLYAIESDHRWQPSVPYTEAQMAVLERYLEYIEPRLHALEQSDVSNAREKVKTGSNWSSERTRGL